MSLGTLSASLALSSLCSVRALLQAVLQTEDMLKVYEARLTEEETVCLDLDKVEAYRCGLKVTQGSQLWPGLQEVTGTWPSAAKPHSIFMSVLF